MSFPCGQCQKFFPRNKFPSSLPADATPTTHKDSLLCFGCATRDRPPLARCVKCGVKKPKTSFLMEIWGMHDPPYESTYAENLYALDCDDESKLECKTCLPRSVYDREPRLAEIPEFCQPWHHEGIHFYRFPPNFGSYCHFRNRSNLWSSLEGSYEIFFLLSYCVSGTWGTHQRTVKGLLTIAKHEESTNGDDDYDSEDESRYFDPFYEGEETSSGKALLTITMEQSTSQKGERDPDHISKLEFQMVLKNGRLKPHSIQSEGPMKQLLMDHLSLHQPEVDVEPTGRVCIVRDRFPMPLMYHETYDAYYYACQKDDSSSTRVRRTNQHWFGSVKEAEEVLTKHCSAPKWMNQMTPKQSLDGSSPSVCLDEFIVSKVWEYVREAPPPVLFLEPGDLILDIDWHGGRGKVFGDHVHVLVARKKTECR
mmetsp:Transcript_19393/g.53322  ORF Transcript_19393/g.53322 Transcript_19393/m.53322 type:complete len:424 (+) Transcript_19393:449-1720(+)